MEIPEDDDVPRMPSTKIMGGSIVFHEEINSPETIKGLGTVANDLTKATQEFSSSAVKLSSHQKRRHDALQEDLIKTVNIVFSFMVLDPASFASSLPNMRTSDPKTTWKASELFCLTAMLKEGKSVEEIAKTIEQKEAKNTKLYEAEKTLLNQIGALEHFWQKAGLSPEAAKDKAAGDVDSIVLTVQDREKGIEDYIKRREEQHDLMGHVPRELYPDPNNKQVPPDLRAI